MRKVIGIGETVLDIIFRDEQPISAVPGGSTFNAVVSLGRSGVKCSMISETGNDRVGRNIIHFLEENGVDSSNINVYPESKSPLSLAFLNEKNDADYIFYKDHPNDRIDYIYPDIHPDDIVLFGSFFALNPVIRPQVFAFLNYARQHGAILYYDINFRSSHRHEVMKTTPNLLENLELADIVRGSEEDFDVLYKKNDPDVIYRSQISFYTKKFIYTRAAEPVELRAEKGLSKQYPVIAQQPCVCRVWLTEEKGAGTSIIGYGRITKKILLCKKLQTKSIMWVSTTVTKRCLRACGRFPMA